ncbi:MAG: hypothetical protein EOO41_00660 [Methanobacteriota archaeon]|nr:MAG: hypothetical protein EOO41_00660 [Euryarchaeota archaeon]
MAAPFAPVEPKAVAAPRPRTGSGASDVAPLATFVRASGLPAAPAARVVAGSRLAMASDRSRSIARRATGTAAATWGCTARNLRSMIPLRDCTQAQVQVQVQQTWSASAHNVWQRAR